MRSSFKLCRALPLFLAQRANSSTQFVNRSRHFCNSHSALVEVAEAELPAATAPPELPGWLRLSQGKFLFYTESDGSFQIPEINEWAKNQKIRKIRCYDELVEIGDVEKISRVLKHVFDSPNEVLEAIVSECGEVKASEDLVMKLLVRFSNDWVSAVGVFLWAETRNQFEVSGSLYNLMVDLLGKFRKFEVMKGLVEKMHLSGKGIVTLDTMCKVMRRLARARKWDEAVEVYRTIDRFGIEKNVESLNMLLDVLVKSGGVELAKCVFLEFKKEIHPNADTFNIFIKCWCKAKNVDQAKKMLEEMEEHGLSPTVATYNSFMDVFCRERKFSKVDELLVEMKEKGCAPSSETYNFYIAALGKVGEVRRALDVFDSAIDNGFVPEASLYCSLIYYVGKFGKLEMAEILYKDMLQNGIMPNLLTYNSMIHMYCSRKRATEAIKMLLEMEENNVKPNFMTYDPLLKICCWRNHMKVLAFLLHHMFKNDVSPVAGTYTLLVHELCKSRELEHACIFFEEMILKGFTPMRVTCNLLIRVLQKAGMDEYTEHIAGMIARTDKKTKSKS